MTLCSFFNDICTSTRDSKPNIIKANKYIAFWVDIVIFVCSWIKRPTSLNCLLPCGHGKPFRKWFDEEYPGIARKAREERVEILLGDETGISSEDR